MLVVMVTGYYKAGIVFRKEPIKRLQEKNTAFTSTIQVFPDLC